MHTIFTPLIEFDGKIKDLLPDSLKTISDFTSDPQYIVSAQSVQTRSRYVLNFITTLSFLMLNNGWKLNDYNVYMSAFDANSFSTEVRDVQSGDTTISIFHRANGSLRAISFVQNRPVSLPAFSTRPNISLRELFAAILPIVAAFGYQDSAGMVNFESSSNDEISKFTKEFNQKNQNYENALFGIASAVEAFVVSEEQTGSDANKYVLLKQFPGNNIPPVSDRNLTTLRARGSGVILIDGEPQILSKGSSQETAKSNTFGSIKKEFEAYVSTLQWTEQEKLLIPTFADDFPVPAETLRIARRFIQTRNDIRPMVQFMWRGPTSYGKSTGVECLAALLQTPLCRMTCNTETTTQDFLADFVPDTTNHQGALPSFEDMELDPTGAYQMMTGEYDESVTPQQCLEMYAQVANKSDKPAFKFVESNYIKGLEKGYIVEIQEASRIRNPGVLVGLNEFDRPGSVIPLLNGEYRIRHKNAMVIYTDNIGYASCRPIDPSVLRRTALIIDSDELTKDALYARVKFNTKCKDTKLIDAAYKIYTEVVSYCRKNDMMDEGSASPTEFEMMVRCLMLDGLDEMSNIARECLVNKATSDPDAQDKIMQLIVDPSSSIA